ncbi:MAG: DUF4115 domain-containing protein [Deltaproteobacteria bacterium]|nr:DUF4115 domain-containing protein [Deltaproteobacteria bacterium]
MAEKTHPESPSLESLGRLLSEEREKAGLTRNDLASKTRIAIDQIAKMEDGRFAHLPPVYARGFLKTMAGAMSLDPEAFLGEYRRLSGNKEESPGRPLQKKYVEADIIDDGGGSLGLTAMIIILILAAAVALFFLNPAFRRLATGYLPFLNFNAPARPQGLSPGPSPASGGQLASPPLSPSAAPSLGGLSPADQSQAAPQAGGRLVLRAVKATWSQILVDDGALRFVYFQPGQSQTFDGQKSIAVIAGDGQALRVEWNGQDLGPLGPQGPLELVFPLAR